MAHVVRILDLANAPEEGMIPVLSEQFFADWPQAEEAAKELFAQLGTGAVSVHPDYTLFSEIGDYLRALNTGARWLKANPEPGCWIGALTENLATWAEVDITTPAHLHAYLNGCFEREMEKARYA